MKFLSPINLTQNELQNARIQNLGTAPATPASGQVYYDTTLNKLGYFNGTIWIYGSSQTHVGTLPIVVTAVGDAFTTSINAATTTTAGSMSAADKTLLTNATALATASTIVLRDAAGSFSTTNINTVTGTITTSPVNPTDIANKQYVDALAQGLKTKGSVRMASIANIPTLSGNLTIDGIVTAPGNRILVKNQTTASQNGIYVTAAGAWTRSTDMAIGSSAAAAFTFVEEGSTNADSGWLCITDQGADVVNTNPLTWTQFAGAGNVTAGAGMTQVGSILNVITADNSLTILPDSVAVKVDNVTIETNATNGVQVKASGITATQIATTALAVNGGLVGGAGTAISVVSYTPTVGATVAKKVVVTGSIGSGTATTFVHNLNTKDVNVQIVDATTYIPYYADFETNNLNQITVTANGPATAVRVIIIG